MPETIANLLDTVICGDVLDKLPGIPTGSVHCVVTSPPYWGLRDYGVDGQLGLEKTPEEYIAKMVVVFREVWRVLRDDGTLWLNMGDSYNAGRNGGHAGGKQGSGFQQVDERYQQRSGANAPSLKPKDLCGIPWRLALALQADGWYLRQDIIWHKPNPMPESVTDRCTKAHEYIFLMTKKPRYYYDAEAIKEETVTDIASAAGMTFGSVNGKMNTSEKAHAVDVGHKWEHSTSRNKRSVWTVPTCPYPEAHFATFPPKLIEPCILAGCPEWVCVKCGEPRRRIVEKGELQIPSERKNTQPKEQRSVRDKGWNCEEGFAPECHYESTTTGWTVCGCNAGFDGGIVLDPFMGSGTVAAVAYENNRHYIGIDLNPDQKIQKRIRDVHEKYALFDTAKGGE